MVNAFGSSLVWFSVIYTVWVQFEWLWIEQRLEFGWTIKFEVDTTLVDIKFHYKQFYLKTGVTYHEKPAQGANTVLLENVCDFVYRVFE